MSLSFPPVEIEYPCRTIGARVSARKATFIRHVSEKPVAVVGRLLFCLVRSSSREGKGCGEERGGRGGYSSFSPRCQSHFVSRHAFRPFTPPRIQCDRWNANKKHHTKVATALVDREARASRRVVAPFRQNFLSKFDDRPVCQYSTSTSLANRYANNFSLPFPLNAKSTRMGRGRRGANTSANALSRFGKLKRKVGVDRSTSNGTFNLLTRGGDYASGSS